MMMENWLNPVFLSHIPQNGPLSKVSTQIENSWFSLIEDADSPTKNLIDSLLEDVISKDNSKVVDLWD